MNYDIKYTPDYRFGALGRYNDVYGAPYDWKSQGVISRVAPAFLMRSNNLLLTKMMETIDLWIISLLLAIEKVAKYKDFMSK